MLTAQLNIEKPNLAKIIGEVEQKYQGESSESLMKMTITTKHWKRTLVMKAYSMGKDKMFVKIIKPAKEKGVTTLKVNDNVWNYLPKVDRIIKISSSSNIFLSFVNNSGIILFSFGFAVFLVQTIGSPLSSQIEKLTSPFITKRRTV